VGSRSVRGVTLIELMVALVLGLIVAGAAMAVFITNRQTYIATEGLGRLQEGGRVAFELMSRDLREASTIPCSNETVLKNVVKTTEWWAARTTEIPPPTIANAQWDATSFLGYASGGSDAIQLIAAVSPEVEPIVVRAAPAAGNLLEMNTVTGLTAGDLLLVCDYGFSSKRGPAGTIFQATAIDDSAHTITIAETGNPGNDTGGGDIFVDEADANPQPNGIVSVIHPARWFIAANAHGGKSLFRSRLINDDGALSVVDDEVVTNADEMHLTYLIEGGTEYVAAAAVPAASWGNVVAVRIQLHMVGTDLVDGAPIERTLEHVVTVRNRAL
jgi:type IV pilus assembly protein PilW